MKDSFKYLIILLVLFCSSCGQNSQKKGSQLAVRSFPNVAPPTMMQDQQEIMEFMSKHFWDEFMTPVKGYRCDSLHIAGVEKGNVEQNLANYIYMLETLPLKEARKCISDLASKAQAYEDADTSSNVFESFEELADKYLYDPNSPMRNEDLYLPYASSLASSPYLDEATKGKYAFIARTCALNGVGTKAADFVFSDKNGRQRRLYDIKSEYTLLFFSNPGCESCMEIINVLSNDENINSMVSAGRLAVVNIYIDEDIQAWMDYMPIYPKSWYNGFDPDLVIRTDLIYNVRAIPSLYLLDSDKTVLIKDAVPEKLFNLLARL